MSGTIETLKTAARRAFRRAFHGVIEIQLQDCDDYLWVDGAKEPPEITADRPATDGPFCMWNATSETIQRALEGERAFESAFISGRLTITGDMSVMARLELEDVYG